MFSRWIGLLLHKDLTQLNDKNPGATNLWQSAGAGWGLLGIFLDFMKGYLPLAVLIWTGRLSGNILIPAAIAPVLGHALSPFMRWKGGKSKAVSFGVWSALSDFEISIALAVILALLQVLVLLFHIGKNQKCRTDAWMSVVGMFLLGGYLFVRKFPFAFVVIWLLNLGVFLFANRNELVHTFRRDKGTSDQV
jgi:glycerol-3-phosphate acyltransferase PlsY